jgi:hypothetical protein
VEAQVRDNWSQQELRRRQSMRFCHLGLRRLCQSQLVANTKHERWIRRSKEGEAMGEASPSLPFALPSGKQRDSDVGCGRVPTYH